MNKDTLEDFVLISSPLEISELINSEKPGVIEYVYFNIKEKRIELHERNVLTEEDLICAPTLNMLVPYNQLMQAYVEELNINIPMDESASHFLHRMGLMPDFHILRHERAVEAFNEWLKDKKIKIVVENAGVHTNN